MSIKQKSISTLLGVSLVALLSSSVFANEQPKSALSNDQRFEHMHEYQHMRLNKLADRLAIKASQQAAWDEYVKSVEAMPEKHAEMPGRDADAATTARYRADRAEDFAKKLSAIADATAKLQKALTADQQKIFNQVSHFSHHPMGHQWIDHCQMGGAQVGQDMSKHP